MIKIGTIRIQLTSLHSYLLYLLFLLLRSLTAAAPPLRSLQFYRLQMPDVPGIFRDGPVAGENTGMGNV
jgi:hypothetical protein